MADEWIYVKAITDEDFETLQTDFPNLSLEARANFEIESVLAGEAVTYRFYEPTAINAIKLEAGTQKLSKNEVLVDQWFAITNHLDLNDTLSILVDHTTLQFKIVGLFNAPEFAYKSTDFSDPSSNKQGFGILIASDTTLNELNHHSDFYLEAQAELEKELADAQASLDEATAELIDAQSSLDEQVSLAKLQYASMPLILNQVLAHLNLAQETLDEHFIEVQDKT